MTDTYADPADLLLGDLEVSSAVDLTAYLRRASRDVDLALSEVYVTPIDPTENALVDAALRNITADLASASLLFAQAAPAEDGSVNAYALFLYHRAVETLRYYASGERILPGVPRNEDPTGTTAPVAITQEDSTSGVAAFYSFVQPPLPVPTPWRAGQRWWPGQ